MTDKQDTPAPKTVPQSVRDVFEKVVDEQHAALKLARIVVKFAEKKQADPVKLKRITDVAVRDEANADAVLKICPDWFGKHNPAQVRMGVEDQTADLYREMDIALMGVGLQEEVEDGLAVQHPELRNLHKAEAMRYGVAPHTDAWEVVEVLVKRAEQGLEYGQALPSKYDPQPETEQDALPGAQDAADGDSEEDGGVAPDEDTEEAPEPSSVSQVPGAIDPDNPWANVGEAEEAQQGS